MLNSCSEIKKTRMKREAFSYPKVYKVEERKLVSATKYGQSSLRDAGQNRETARTVTTRYGRLF